MTDGDPTSEIGEEPKEETIGLFIDKTTELMEGQKGEKYFRIETPKGTRAGRVWVDNDKTRYLDDAGKAEANVSIFTIFGNDPEYIEKNKPPFEFEEVIVIRSKDKTPWVFLNKNRIGGNDVSTSPSVPEPNFYDLLPRNTDKISLTDLNAALSRYRATQADLQRYTSVLSTVQKTDEISQPNFFKKPEQPHNPR